MRRSQCEGDLKGVRVRALNKGDRSTLKVHLTDNGAEETSLKDDSFAEETELMIHLYLICGEDKQGQMRNRGDRCR